MPVINPNAGRAPAVTQPPPVAVPAAQVPAPSSGGLSTLMNDPYRLNLLLGGLGMMFADTRNQQDHYLGGINKALMDRAAWEREAPERARQERLAQSTIDYNTARTADLGNPEDIFSGRGAEVSAMRVVDELGRKMARGERLTPEEEVSYQLAVERLKRDTVIQTPTGPQRFTGMNLDFMNQYRNPGAGTTPGAAPGAVSEPGVTTPATPPDATGAGGDLPVLPVPEKEPESELPRADPFRQSDVERIVEMQKNASTWSEITPLFDAIEKDMEIFATSPTADLERQGRSLAAMIGLGDEKTLAAGERLSKNINKLVSENMAFLKGAMSEGEREFTKQFSLSMNTSVAGNRAYIAFLRKVAQRAKQKAPMARRYFRNNKDSLDGFDEAWMAYVEENPVEIPDIEGINDSAAAAKKERDALREELGL